MALLLPEIHFIVTLLWQLHLNSFLILSAVSHPEDPKVRFTNTQYQRMVCTHMVIGTACVL